MIIKKINSIQNDFFNKKSYLLLSNLWVVKFVILGLILLYIVIRLLFLKYSDISIDGKKLSKPIKINNSKTICHRILNIINKNVLHNLLKNNFKE